MPARPVPELTYRQEYYKGEAEDRAAVISVGEEQVEVPYGYFNKRVLMTRDWCRRNPGSKSSSSTRAVSGRCSASTPTAPANARR